MTMLAYHNDPALRAAALDQMEAHAAADQIMPGYGYWKDGKGCAVGCLTHDPRGGHATYPTRWGIPESLARLEDRIFEGLLPEEARAWPVAFLSAIPLGADLSGVTTRFLLALLVDPAHGVVRHTGGGSAQQAAVMRVARLLEQKIGGAVVSTGAWREAAAEARAAAATAYAANAYATYAADADAADAAYAAYAAADAAAYAAYAAAYAAAAAAAYAAAVAAADAVAAAYAAYAADAYAADATAAARRSYYGWASRALLALLAAAPVPA